MPTLESSVVIRPMRSSLGRILRDLKIPSLRILMRQSAFGRPGSGVWEEAEVVRCGDGGSLWKYQHRVAQSIIATWREGDAGVLKSLLEGTETEEMKSESLWSVGRVKRWEMVTLWSFASGGSSPRPMYILLLLLMRSSSSSSSSSVERFTVQPGGIAEWCMSRSLLLKV